MHIRGLGLVAAVLVGCSIKVPSGVLKCTTDADCPESYLCHAEGTAPSAGNFCYARGDVPHFDAGAGAADSGTPTHADAGMSDLGIARIDDPCEDAGAHACSGHGTKVTLVCHAKLCAMTPSDVRRRQVRIKGNVCRLQRSAWDTNQGFRSV